MSFLPPPPPPTTGATSLATAEIVGDGALVSRFGVEEFVTDGVILLKDVTLGKESTKTLEVKKMRRTKITGGTHTFDFTKTGIKVVD